LPSKSAGKFQNDVIPPERKFKLNSWQERYNLPGTVNTELLFNCKTLKLKKGDNMLKEGDKAPEFSLKDSNGNTVSLKDFHGKKVVLYFYPKDDTPGCTKEACSFRDNLPEFGKLNAVVLGISADSEASHKKFASKYELPFTLLSDPDKQVIQEYEVWKEKNLYGKKSMGIERTTFVIDENGRIMRVFPKVKVDGHVEEVMNVIGSRKETVS
jgi:peroxiredoxin Q/BCP